MKLSKNFSLNELKHSDTAIRKSIDNMPNEEHIDNLETLAKELLQPIRDHLGRPITISSGFRSRKLNTKLRGAKSSHHMRGMAADLVFDGMDTVFPWIVENLKYTQVIFEESGRRRWIHVSYDKDNLKQEALTYKNGKYMHY